MNQPGECVHCETRELAWAVLATFAIKDGKTAKFFTGISFDRYDKYSCYMKDGFFICHGALSHYRRAGYIIESAEDYLSRYYNCRVVNLKMKEKC